MKVRDEVTSVREGDKIVADIEAEEGWLGVQIDVSYANYMRIPERSQKGRGWSQPNTARHR